MRSPQSAEALWTPTDLLQDKKSWTKMFLCMEQTSVVHLQSFDNPPPHPPEPGWVSVNGRDFNGEQLVTQPWRRTDNTDSCQANKLVKNTWEKFCFQNVIMVPSSPPLDLRIRSKLHYSGRVVRVNNELKSLRVFVMMHIPCFCVCLCCCSLRFGLAALQPGMESVAVLARMMSQSS